MGHRTDTDSPGFAGQPSEGSNEEDIVGVQAGAPVKVAFGPIANDKA